MRGRIHTNGPKFQPHGRPAGPSVRQHHRLRAREDPVCPDEPNNRGVPGDRPRRQIPRTRGQRSSSQHGLQYQHRPAAGSLRRGGRLREIQKLRAGHLA